MGVSTSPAQLAGKMFAASAVVRTASTTGTEAAAIAFKKAAQAAAPSRLRGVGKNGATLGVRYNGGKYGDGAKYLVYATGPWQLIESDTKAHPIPALIGQRSRAKRRLYGPAFGGVANRKFVAFGGNVYSQVFHPGTKGKHPWAKTEAVMIPLIPKIIARGTVAALGAIF